jgi:hypothetical protein
MQTMQQTAKTGPRQTAKIQTAKRRRADTPRDLELLNGPGRNKGSAFTPNVTTTRSTWRSRVSAEGGRKASIT